MGEGVMRIGWRGNGMLKYLRVGMGDEVVM
jgi:hypothetical protein